MLPSVLVANRGEIAVRIIRTLRRLGIRSIAVYSEPDAGSRHVDEADEALLIGPASLAESYLSVERILEAAQRSGAAGLHPGYGFLSEAPALALACEERGIVFVGPSAATIELMGDKIRAKQLVAAAGIPTVPGRAELGLSDAELVAAVEEIGYPVLLKPSAGGGGKGMRLLEDATGLAEQIASSRREALSAFGDGTLFVERYLPRARHLEVQILADAFGATLHVGERECSLQRRHQKIIEEAPSPLLDESQRQRLGELAVAVARAGGYLNAGTVEFIVNAEDPDEAYFMEMNSRLQVEHPVTEEVWGIDLVEQQLLIAAGEPLSLSQEALAPRGHAVEARIYAEDPAAGFLPTGGRILRLHEPRSASVRVESGLSEGSVVGTSFDPMLSKIVAWGPDRSSALQRLDRALSENLILGLTTNTGFLRSLLTADEVRQGDLDTGLVERLAPSIEPLLPDRSDLAAAALLALLIESRPEGAWDLSGWRLSGRARSVWTALCGGRQVLVEIERDQAGWSLRLDEEPEQLRATATIDGAEAEVEVDGLRRRYLVVHGADGLWLGRDGVSWHFTEPDAADVGLVGSAADHVASPMPGVVTAVPVVEGQEVEEGEVLVVVEAMKMEHSLRSPRAGRISVLRASAGDQVVLGQILAELEGVSDVL